MKKAILFLFILSFSGCVKGNKNINNKIEKNAQIEVIDLAGQLNKKVTAEHSLSDAAVALDIVLLEMNDATLLSRINNIVVTSDNIFVCDSKVGVCRFDRKGKFLNKISKKGSGPGEYMYINKVQVDESNRYVYLYDYGLNCIFKYDFEGSFLNKAVNNTNEFIAGTNACTFSWNNKLFMVDILPALYEKNAYPTFFLFNQDGSIKKTYINPAMKDKSKEIWENCELHIGWKNFWGEPLPSMSFYNNNFLMAYYQSDTIYKFDETTECFTPQYIVNLGNKPNFDEAHKWIKDENFFKYLTLYRFYETEKYLYFQLTKDEVLYIARYDKGTKEITSYEKETTIKRTNLPGSPGFVVKNIQKSFPFKNDFCGGIFDIKYVSGGKYWITTLTPEIIEEMDIKKTEEDVVKDQTLKQKYLKILKETKMDDNPILLIATLK